MKAGSYTLDLYCDLENQAHAFDEFPHQFFHEYGAVCRSRARASGWVIGKEKDVCPKCSGKKEKQ